MEINHSFIEGVLVLKPEGDIDHHSAMDMLGSMRSIRDMYMPPRIMLDMSDVGFMDSSGIAVVTGLIYLSLNMLTASPQSLILQGLQE